MALVMKVILKPYCWQYQGKARKGKYATKNSGYVRTTVSFDFIKPGKFMSR